MSEMLTVVNAKDNANTRHILNICKIFIYIIGILNTLMNYN